MNIQSFKAALQQNPDLNLRLVLPDGDPIPAAFHITEVGHVAKNFIDCGGTVRAVESCLLQAWVSEKDSEHRLSPGKLAGILDLARRVVPSEDLEVEVEYERGAVGQYTIEAVASDGDVLVVSLGNKQTDCLAREACGVGDEGCGCGSGAGEGGCC